MRFSSGSIYYISFGLSVFKFQFVLMHPPLEDKLVLFGKVQLRLTELATHLTPSAARRAHKTGHLRAPCFPLEAFAVAISSEHLTSPWI